MSFKHIASVRKSDQATEVSCAIAATPRQNVSARPIRSSHETADIYVGIITPLSPQQRVIECKDQIQWIVQRRKNGGAERPWRSVGYFRTRDALIRACATLCERVDPNAMAILLALPSHFGGAS